MTAFLFTGWLTFCVAAIPGYYRFLEDDRKFRKRRGKRLWYHRLLEAFRNISNQEDQNRRWYKRLLAGFHEGRAQGSEGHRDGSSQPQFNGHGAFEMGPIQSSSPSSIPSIQRIGQQGVPTNQAQDISTVTNHSTSGSNNTDTPWQMSAAVAFLEPLCDLQLATGTAILIAGLAQGKDLNYYHESFISSYWGLTLNSFWAARISSDKYDAVDDLPSFVRTSAILCSLILSIFFQSREIFHSYPQHGNWNPADGSRCYLLNHDQSGEGQAWLWLVGLSIYALALSLRLLRHVFAYIRPPVQNESESSRETLSVEANEAEGVGGTTVLWIIGCLIHLLAGLLRLLRKVTRVCRPTLPIAAHHSTIDPSNVVRGNDVFEFDFMNGNLTDFRKCLQDSEGKWSWLNNILTCGQRIFSFHALDIWLVTRDKERTPNRGLWQRLGDWILQWPLRILIFALTNFLAVWSFGSGSFGMETLALLGYLAWNTLDIIDSKISNRYLVQNELAWGFGQVLPMVLLGTFIFGALDVYQVRKDKKEGEATGAQ